MAFGNGRAGEQALVGVGFDDVKFRKMEIAVLSSLGWRTLGATANDFLVNMIAQLPALGLPAHLLTSLVCRSEEVMRILLPGKFQRAQLIFYARFICLVGTAARMKL